MKNKLKCLFLSLFVFCFSIVDIFAAPANTIYLSKVEKQTAFVAGTYWGRKILSDGSYAYCLNHQLSAPAGQTLTYKGELDAGFAYIILNGFPNKSITGNADLDNYITQGAVHWYQDRISGIADNQKGQMTVAFKTNGSDVHGLRPHMKNLVENALTARNQGYVKPSGNISVSSSTMSLTSDGKYFISNPIKLSTTNGLTSSIDSLSVKLEGAPSGSSIVDASGNTKTGFGSGDVFYVKVPTSSLTSLKASFKITLSGTGTLWKAARYESNPKYQNLVAAKPFSETNNFGNSLTFELTTTKLIISKQDITTEKELPGATLVITDSEGNEIDRWVSTDEQHEISNLPAGEYTLTEITAPDGYVKADSITFTLNADGTVKTVIMFDDYTKVKISKQDVTTKKELPGAKLKLYDEDGNLVDEWTSTDEEHYIERLKVGKYKLVEEIAPDGYVLSREAVEFEVKETGEIQTAVMYNTPVTPTPDTGFRPSMYLYIVAAGISLVGLFLILKNRKQQS